MLAGFPEADSGAVTLIQRFGSAANLNIHLHCLVLLCTGAALTARNSPTKAVLDALNRERLAVR